jgi:hypothetical protein
LARHLHGDAAAAGEASERPHILWKITTIPYEITRIPYWLTADRWSRFLFWSILEWVGGRSASAMRGEEKAHGKPSTYSDSQGALSWTICAISVSSAFFAPTPN